MNVIRAIGSWVTLTTNHGRPTLLIDCDLESAVVIPLGTRTVNEALEYHFEHSNDAFDLAKHATPTIRKSYIDLIRRAFHLAIYISAVNADLSPDGSRPGSPEAAEDKARPASSPCVQDPPLGGWNP